MIPFEAIFVCVYMTLLFCAATKADLRVNHQDDGHQRYNMLPEYSYDDESTEKQLKSEEESLFKMNPNHFAAQNETIYYLQKELEEAEEQNMENEQIHNLQKELEEAKKVLVHPEQLNIEHFAVLNEKIRTVQTKFEELKKKISEYEEKLQVQVQSVKSDLENLIQYNSQSSSSTASQNIFHMLCVLFFLPLLLVVPIIIFSSLYFRFTTVSRLNTFTFV